jgi:hypothetical protein
MNRREFLGRFTTLGVAGTTLAVVGLPIIESDVPTPVLVGDSSPELLALPEIGPTLQQIKEIVPEADLSEQQLRYTQFGLREFGVAKVYYKEWIANVDDALSGGLKRLVLTSQSLHWDGSRLLKGLPK